MTGHTRTPAELIDRAALLKHLRKARDEYVDEHFVTDPGTEVLESSAAKEECVSFLDDNIRFIENFPGAAPTVNRDHAFDEVVKALELAKFHLLHMAAWIEKQNSGYSFEALGEDMPGIDAALAKAGSGK